MFSSYSYKILVFYSTKFFFGRMAKLGKNPKLPNINFLKVFSFKEMFSFVDL